MERSCLMAIFYATILAILILTLYVVHQHILEVLTGVDLVVLVVYACYLFVLYLATIVAAIFLALGIEECRRVRRCPS